MLKLRIRPEQLAEGSWVFDLVLEQEGSTIVLECNTESDAQLLREMISKLVSNHTIVKAIEL